MIFRNDGQSPEEGQPSLSSYRRLQREHFTGSGPQQEQIGGAAYRVGDAYVWSTIHYLDSATDYREYLSTRKRRSSMLLLALGLAVLTVVTGLTLLSWSLSLS